MNVSTFVIGVLVLIALGAAGALWELRNRKPEARELRYVPVKEAHALISLRDAQGHAVWRLAPEEDMSININYVYLERTLPVTIAPKG